VNPKPGVERLSVLRLGGVLIAAGMRTARSLEDAMAFFDTTRDGR
jgi:hypothetical protein